MKIYDVSTNTSRMLFFNKDDAEVNLVTSSTSEVCMKEVEVFGECAEINRLREALPWLRDPLMEWRIVGMNHYTIGGVLRLFVAMTKDGRCIKAEGDERYVWDNLITQAKQALEEGKTP